MEAPCLYFAVSEEGRLVAVNDLLCHHLHYTQDELLGQKQELLFTLSTRIFQQTHFFPLLKLHGSAEEIYITLLTKERAELPVLVNAVRQQTEEGFVTRYAGLVVQNRKKFEDELVEARRVAETALKENTAVQQARNELRQHAEKLDQQMYLVSKQNEELRQFNHVVTHELQEPLRKLFLFTNLLLESEGAKANSHTVSKIMSVAEQMRTLLSGLQQYVWLTETAIKPTTLDLNAMLTMAVEQFRSQGAVISLSVEPIPPITGDSAQFEFMLRELVQNAVRFRKQDQPVQLSVRCTPVQINKYKSMPDNYEYTGFLKLDFCDNGQGFDAAYKEQVFELFKRLHTSSGRGVGLALCKKVVENHSGSISIDSQPMVGTTVTILLPSNPFVNEAKPASLKTEKKP